ncbi:hypothetical protein N7512_003720 [Penicillium capsulatum]|nr:hypothetical protein N7512_003720 [Penicillium capsulatum]
MASSAGADPLTLLPPEIVLRVLEFAPIAVLASLTSVSKAWHQFIDVTHQEAIYASESKTIHPSATGTRSLSPILQSKSASFAKLFEGTSSWKDLCKRQTLLSRNWDTQQPVSQESVLQVGNHPVWRFRPDFKRRFFVSTSHAAGLNVTDMDTGRIIWHLPSVRAYAHLEYQDGMAVFDREGDAVEVWQTDLDGCARGEFRRIAILNHECQTRGFQLSYWTLCVVSNEGQGFVYDMSQRPPTLTTHLKIEHGAVGHLDQSEDAVIYSIGSKGYYAYDKKTGGFLGILQPSQCTDQYHIRPPTSASPSPGAALAGAVRHGPAQIFSPAGPPRRDCLVPIHLRRGPLPSPTDPDHVRLAENEWGAGMLDGDVFVGFSRAGRVFVCSNWRKALGDQESLSAHSSLIECESDGSSFDLGGWLAVRNHRVMFEIQERVYIVALDDNDRIQPVDDPPRASYSLLTSSAPQLAVPISFMTLCDDAIMTTYTTLGWRQSLSDLPAGVPRPQHDNPARIFPTKAIRVVNLAPSLSNEQSQPAREPAESPAPDAPDLNQPGPAADEIWRSQAGLLQLVSMLQDEFGDEEHDELWATATDFHDDDGEWEDEEEGGA